MITTEDDCEEAFNQIAISGYTWHGLHVSTILLPGCFWDSASSVVKFNSAMDGVSNQGNTIGGLCRVGGTIL
jgi:hypothetical protein